MALVILVVGVLVGAGVLAWVACVAVRIIQGQRYMRRGFKKMKELTRQMKVAASEGREEDLDALMRRFWRADELVSAAINTGQPQAGKFEDI
jgi:uncharacterized membrane protein (DUF106 family)